MSLVFRKIRREDAYKFARWGRHSDPRLYQYNLDFESRREYETWYYMKQRVLFRKVYGLFLDDQPIGFATLKNIRWFRGKAELGIAIDPSLIGMGYGSKLLEAYLNYVFTRFPLKVIELKVAHFNKRAQKSYEKAGFVKVGESYEPYEEQGYKDIIMDLYPDQFDLVDGVLYTTFHIMRYYADTTI